MRHWTAHVFHERLGLTADHPDQLVIPCPLHGDVDTASLSLDLARGLFYCFGACTEPKGGGAIQFLIKWALKDGRIITAQEARRALNRPLRPPDAQELLRQIARQMMHEFAAVMLPAAADMIRTYESLTQWLRPEEDPEDWNRLAYATQELTWWTCVHDVCAESLTRDVHPWLIALVYPDAKRRGLWDDIAGPLAYREGVVRRLRLARTHQEIREAFGQDWLTPITPTQETACLANPSSSPTTTAPPRPRRQAVIL